MQYKKVQKSSSTSILWSIYILKGVIFQVGPTLVVNTAVPQHPNTIIIVSCVAAV